MKSIPNQRSLKLIPSLLLAFLLTSSLLAQVPESINYQAVLRDGDGVIRANESVEIQLKLHQGGQTGTSVFDETHSLQTNAFGLVNLQIGSVNTADFSAVDWSTGSYYLEVLVDGTQIGNTQLLSVPFALHAKSSDEAASTPISGSETAFDDWDKNASDDFSGSYDDLSGSPWAMGSGEISTDDDLNINGVVEADSYDYGSSQTRYLSLSSHHFTADNSAIPLIRTNVRYVYFPSGAGIAVASAPLNLPEGAEIQEMTAFLADNDPAEDATVYLRWYDHTDAFGVLCSCGTSNAENSSSVFSKTTSTITDATIDNFNRSYWVSFRGAASNANIKLHSVRIKYTVDSAD